MTCLSTRTILNSRRFVPGDDLVIGFVNSDVVIAFSLD